MELVSIAGLLIFICLTVGLALSLIYIIGRRDRKLKRNYPPYIHKDWRKK